MNHINEIAFSKEVENWIIKAIAQGKASFDQILDTMPGVYPAVVLSTIRQLVQRGNLPIEILYETQVEDIRTPVQHDDSFHSIKLPIPHPLDYDWRFHENGTQLILEKCQQLSAKSGPIVLLGAPSVMRAAIEQKYPYDLMLLDINKPIIDKFSNKYYKNCALQCDVTRDTLPDILASVVILDPPWYEEYLKSFLWAACQMCVLGGHLLVSMPPQGTRPGMKQEREKILNWTRQIGLTLMKIELAALPYTSPLFERNALRALGLNNITDWRRGDLFVFSHTHQITAQRPIVTNQEENWAEEVLSGVRIRIRDSEEIDFKDPSLISIIEDDILTTVSRRDDRRKLVDVWTSGNRIFTCQGTRILHYILKAVVNKTSPYTTIRDILNRQLSDKEVRLISHVVDQVNKLVNLEQKEILSIGDRSYDITGG